jgi:hypothetical protein
MGAMERRKTVGKFNSSVTRVWPVLGALLRRDPTGRQWLSGLSPALRLGSLAPLLPETVQRREVKFGDFGTVSLPNCFEHGTAPPEPFLRWMIENAGPSKAWNFRFDGNSDTEAKRKKLLSGDPEFRREALDRLSERGAKGSLREWWAFEGFTSIDCCLETADFLLVIEGKRTESLSSSTTYFKKRNQLARNLEIAQSLANDRDFALLLIAERPLSNEDAKKLIKNGLPHLSAHEEASLAQHYLGCVTWSDVCDRNDLWGDLPGGKLSGNIDEAREILLEWGWIKH